MFGGQTTKLKLNIRATDTKLKLNVLATGNKVEAKCWSDKQQL